MVIQDIVYQKWPYTTTDKWRHGKSGCRLFINIRLYSETVSNGLYLRSLPFCSCDTFTIQLLLYRNCILMTPIISLYVASRFTSRFPCRRSLLLYINRIASIEPGIHFLTLVWFTLKVEIQFLGGPYLLCLDSDPLIIGSASSNLYLLFMSVLYSRSW